MGFKEIDDISCVVIVVIEISPILRDKVLIEQWHCRLREGSYSLKCSGEISCLTRGSDGFCYYTFVIAGDSLPILIRGNGLYGCGQLVEGMKACDNDIQGFAINCWKSNNLFEGVVYGEELLDFKIIAIPSNYNSCLVVNGSEMM